jgi:TolB-like protein
VDVAGDSLLAEFRTARDAVECAVEVQRVLKARNAGLSEDRRMEFRVGVHLGDVMAEGDRIYGDGVNIAARLQALADPGGTCISGEVYGQVHHKLDLRYADLGEQAVKNLPDPVRVYRVESEVEAAPPDASPRSLRRAVLTVAAVVLLGAVAAVGWRMFAGDSVGPDGTPISAPIRSIAVLPLENLSGDPEQEYFADGMTEAVISQFARIGSLRVISRTSVMQYKKAKRSLPEIARELNVQGVVEGSVLRVGERVRITLQLIDARNDHHLWAQSYERDLHDVLALQGEIARAVAQQVDTELTPEEQARLRTADSVDPEAHDAYLRGTLHLAKTTIPDALEALEYFERAIELDPGYARAYSGLSRTYVELAFGHGELRPHDAMPRARAAAEKAIELDESLGSARSNLGLVLSYYDWEWERAEMEHRRAVELSPSDARIVDLYGLLLTMLGRHDEGLVLMERAVNLGSLELVVRSDYSLGLMMVRDFEGAIRESMKVLEIDPDFLWARFNLAAAYQFLGRDGSAYQSWTTWQRLVGRDEAWMRGWESGYRKSGLRGARRYWLTAETERAETEYVDPAYLATLSAALGDADATFRWLERAYEERPPMLPLWLGGWAGFDPYREDPRFEDLLRRMSWPRAS